MVPIKDIELTILRLRHCQNPMNHAKLSIRLINNLDLENTPVFLLAQIDDWDTTEYREKILDIQQQLLDDPLVDQVTSMFTVANIDSGNVGNG